MTSVRADPVSEDAAAPAAPPRWAMWAVLGLTLLTAALRIVGLRESFFGDELFTYEIASRHSLAEVLTGVQSNLEVTPPLFFIVAWVFGKAGNLFVWLRLASILASTATVPLLYLLGRRTMGWQAGVVAGGFWALSPMAMFYGVEARSYALMMMLVVLATLAMLRAVEKGSWPRWAAVTAAYAACMYTNYTCIYVLVGLAGWALLTHRGQWRRLLTALAAALVLYLPWLPSMMDDLNSPNQLIYNIMMPLSPHVAVEETLRLFTQGPYLPISWAAVVLIGAAGIVAVAGLGIRIWAQRRAALSAGTVLLAVLALAAPVGALTQSLLGNDMYAARNLTSSLPAAYLLLAGLLLALPRLWAVLGLILAALGFSVSTAAALDSDNIRPAYRQVADFVDQEAQPGDHVVEVTTFVGPPSNGVTVHLDPSLDYQRVDSPAELGPVMTDKNHRYLLVLPILDPPEIPGYKIVRMQSWPGLQPYRVVIYAPTE